MCNCPISRPISRHGRGRIDEGRVDALSPHALLTMTLRDLHLRLSQTVLRVSNSRDLIFSPGRIPLSSPEQPVVSALRVSVPTSGPIGIYVKQETARSAGQTCPRKARIYYSDRRQGNPNQNTIRWIFDKNHELRTVQSTGPSPSSPYSFLSHSLAVLK